MEQINKELDKTRLTLDEKIKEANEKARQYRILLSRLKALGDKSQLAQRAQRLLEAGKLEDARKILENIEQQSEKDVDKAAESSFNLGEILQLESKPSEAAPHLQKAYQYRPNVPIYGIEYADALLRQGRILDAAPICEHNVKLLSTIPSSEVNQLLLVHSLVMLGKAYQLRQDFASASKCFEHALKIAQAPSDLDEISPAFTAEILLAMADLKDRSGEFPAAETNASKAFEIYEKLKIGRAHV